MKLALWLASLGLVSCAAVPSQVPAPSPSAPRENHITLYLGQRNLDKDDYSPVEKQPTFGVEFSQEKQGSPVGWEVGLMGSSDDGNVGGTGVTVSTGELYGGVRKTFGEGAFRPYLGGGVSLIRLKAEVSGGGSDDDTSGALYAHGGLAFAVSDAVSLGLDLRVLFGSDINISGFKSDADYGQLAFVIAFGI